MIIPPILTTALIHVSLKGWEDVTFYLGSERVNKCTRLFQFFNAISWLMICSPGSNQGPAEKEVIAGWIRSARKQATQPSGWHEV